ncbi:hypothetical protein HBNXHr_2182 [Halorhabdus sp. BNX81]|nr:hypothetical protein HBNXHr_2182 [Halorhabdus sp. BNX81]
MYKLLTVATLFVGISIESWPLIAFGTVLFLGVFRVNQWVASQTGIQRNDERTRQLVRKAAIRALFGLLGVSFLLYLGGEALAAWDTVPETLATLSKQGEIVAVWTAAATIASSLVHKVGDQLRRRRLEG